MRPSTHGRDHRRTARRRRGAAIAAGALAAAAALSSGAGWALALFGDAEQVAATTSTAPSFSATTYYLHNNPTPPTGSTNMQANLEMDATAPTAAMLFNYDADHDAAPGRLIERGGSGAGETDLARFQNWRGPAAPLLPQVINGTVIVEFWSAIRDFTPATPGEVRVFLRDRDTVTGLILEIASTTVSAADWQAGSAGFVKRTASFSVSHTLLVGHQLEVKLLVGAGAADDMWFAYDTSLYPTRVRLL